MADSCNERINLVQPRRGNYVLDEPIQPPEMKSTTREFQR